VNGGGHGDILFVGGLHIAAEVVDLGFLAFTACCPLEKHFDQCEQ
jgi:hypothetical protein